MLSCLCSPSHFIQTTLFVCIRMCFLDCFAPSAPSPVVVLYCVLVKMMGAVPPRIAPSRTHTHTDIKGSFSGQPAQESVCCLRLVCMCAHLCDSKNITFNRACRLCLILCACPNHESSHWYASFLTLPQSFSPSQLSFLPSFFRCPYFSSPYEILVVLRQLPCPSTMCINYWILPGEPLLSL